MGFDSPPLSPFLLLLILFHKAMPTCPLPALVSCGCCDKVPPTGWLKQKCILSHPESCKYEVKADQFLLVLSCLLLVAGSPSSFGLWTCPSSPCLCLHTEFSQQCLCVHTGFSSLCPNFSLLLRFPVIGLGPTL